MCKSFASLEENIGYTFKQKSLLRQALTHSSYANENRNLPFNERLEFLGDAVLSLITAGLLYGKFPDMPEGQLTKLRSALVCTASLSGYARQISLGDFLLLGKGRTQTAAAGAIQILKTLLRRSLPQYILTADLPARGSL